jgi:hypothetical protein
MPIMSNNIEADVPWERWLPSFCRRAASRSLWDPIGAKCSGTINGRKEGAGDKIRGGHHGRRRRYNKARRNVVAAPEPSLTPKCL